MPGWMTMQEFLMFYAGISFLASFHWLISFIYSKKRNYLILTAATVSGVIFYLNFFEIIFNYKKVELVFLALIGIAFYSLASELHRYRKNFSALVFYTYIADKVL